MAFVATSNPDWQTACQDLEADSVVTSAVQQFCTPLRTHRPPAECELLKTGETFSLSNGISGVSWGRGPRVLIVHGWCGRSTQLNGFVQPLVDSGRSVIAIDCWGHGDSPGQESHGVAFAKSIMLCAQEKGPFDAAIGHSLGAAAMLVCLSVGLELDRAVLIAPPELHTVIKRFTEKLGLSADESEAFTPALEKIAGMSREDFLLKKIVRGVQAPLMIVHDINDREVPVYDIEELLRNCPQASLMSVSGFGHKRIIKSGEVIAGAVSFITAPGAC